VNEVASLLYYELRIVGVDFDTDRPVASGLYLDTTRVDVNVDLRVAADGEFLLDHSSIVARCRVAPPLVVRV